jgi:hypothetical protein
MVIASTVCIMNSLQPFGTVVVDAIDNSTELLVWQSVHSSLVSPSVFFDNQRLALPLSIDQ